MTSISFTLWSTRAFIGSNIKHLFVQSKLMQVRVSNSIPSQMAGLFDFCIWLELIKNSRNVRSISLVVYISHYREHLSLLVFNNIFHNIYIKFRNTALHISCHRAQGVKYTIIILKQLLSKVAIEETTPSTSLNAPWFH